MNLKTNHGLTASSASNSRSYYDPCTSRNIELEAMHISNTLDSIRNMYTNLYHIVTDLKHIIVT